MSGLFDDEAFVAPANPGRCPDCGGSEVKLTWQRFANGTRHIRASCANCGRFIRYVAQTREARAAADRGAG